MLSRIGLHGRVVVASGDPRGLVLLTEREEVFEFLAHPVDVHVGTVATAFDGRGSELAGIRVPDSCGPANGLRWFLGVRRSGR